MEAILKSYKLLIYGDKLYTANSFCKTVLKQRHTTRPSKFHNTKLFERLSRSALPILREYYVLKAQRHANRFTDKLIKTVV